MRKSKKSWELREPSSLKSHAQATVHWVPEQEVNSPWNSPSWAVQMDEMVSEQTPAMQQAPELSPQTVPSPRYRPSWAQSASLLMMQTWPARKTQAPTVRVPSVTFMREGKSWAKVRAPIGGPGVVAVNCQSTRKPVFRTSR